MSNTPADHPGRTDRTGELVISDLRGGPDGMEILQGLNLTVRSGEVHAVMGPNGSGKSTLSHLLLGRPGFTVTGGSVTLDGEDLLALPTWKRAQAGLFLGLQYPTEVPGVSLLDAMEASLSARAGGAGISMSEVEAAILSEAGRIGFDERFLTRPLNVGLSGGEKKRNETLQMGVLAPRFAILDEIDSGLDVDALRAVSRRVMSAASDDGLGVIAITHYNRLLDELRPHVVHVFVKGRIVASGGPELALELETTGYEPYIRLLPPEPLDSHKVGRSTVDDPFADPFAGL